MQFGFEEVSEKEQESNKRWYQFDRKLKNFEHKAGYAILGMFLVTMLVFAIRELVAGDIERFWYFTKVIMGFAGVIILTHVVLGGIFKLLDKQLEFNPENERAKIEKLGALSLQKVLSTMTENVGLILSNVMGGCIIVTILIVMVDYAEFTFEHILTVLGMVGIADAICIFVHTKRNYVTSLLKQTRQVYEMEDENVWVSDIDASVQNSLLYCSSRLALTSDYIISSLGTDMVLYPIAIPRKDIVEARYYTQAFTSSKNNSYVGILACKLVNGKVVNLYLGRNGAHRKSCRALDYYGFDYVKNEEMRY